ncbi:hypothetical protein [Laribacter hongkongensis]|nr:hypothetical protein [Laribacter hongkongensis]
MILVTPSSPDRQLPLLTVFRRDYQDDPPAALAAGHETTLS